MNKVTILIGLPGCGKDTWIEKGRPYLINTDVHSSDSIREELTGSKEDQSRNAEVFNIMMERTLNSLAADRDVIYNATNLNARKRMNFIKRVKQDFPNAYFQAILFAIPFEVCCERNNARNRVVPEAAMNRMYRSFQPPHEAEGFETIKIIREEAYIENDLKTIKKMCRENRKCPHDNPHHSLSCGDHCDKVQRLFKEWANENNIDMWSIFAYIMNRATLYHDLSKYKVKSFCDYRGRKTRKAHYYGHENVSAYDYLCYCETGSGSDQVRLHLEIANLIVYHMTFFHGQKALDRLKEIYGEDFYEKLELLHKFDAAAH